MKRLISVRSASRARLAFGVLAAFAAFAVVCVSAAPAGARSPGKAPALVISNDPLPPELRDRLYRRPARAPEIDPAQIAGDGYFNDGEVTVVGRKIGDLRNELFSLQGSVADLSEKLASIENAGQMEAATYYASVATISTQLQSGTTPGNPRLVRKMEIARGNLEKLSSNIATLNNLAMEISGAASVSSFLLESVRATYGLAGAVEEDHVQLAQLEDSINNTVVVVERLLNNVNDDITRTAAYVGSERDNLRTLSLAISTGDLFGKSLANRPFSSASPATFTPSAASVADSTVVREQLETRHAMQQPRMMGMGSQLAPAAPASASSPRPLVKIRFDRSDVSYEQPVYMAVNEALSRYPNARLELVAVHPAAGNSAQVAIESTRARRNAEKVLRTLTEMGLSLDRVDLSYAPSREASTNEVHIYIR